MLQGLPIFGKAMFLLKIAQTYFLPHSLESNPRQQFSTYICTSVIAFSHFELLLHHAHTPICKNCHQDDFNRLCQYGQGFTGEER